MPNKRVKRKTLWNSMLIEVYGPKPSELPAKLHGRSLYRHWRDFLRTVAFQANEHYKYGTRLASKGNKAHELFGQFQLKFEGLTFRQLKKKRMLP
jgi:hypothetical protein